MSNGERALSRIMNCTKYGCAMLFIETSYHTKPINMDVIKTWTKFYANELTTEVKPPERDVIVI